MDKALLRVTTPQETAKPRVSPQMKQAAQLGLLAAGNIGIAFLFQWCVITQMGASMQTDALFAGMAVPQLVLVVITGSLMHVLVPLLAGEEGGKSRHDAWAFLFLNGALFALLACILYVSAPWWVPLSVPGFSAEGKAVTIDLTRIQLIGMVFAAINGVQWAAYHARQQFLWAEFTPLLSNSISLVLLIWLLPTYGIYGAAWIATLRLFLQTLLLMPGMGKPLWPDLRNPSVGTAWARLKPLLLGNAFYKTGPVIDRMLLSAAASGNLSLYYLAQQIYGAINQVANKAIVAPLVPLLSKLYKQGEMSAFKHVYRRKLLQTLVLCLIGILVLASAGQMMLDKLIGYGSIRPDNVKDLWWFMIWLSGMFVGGAAGQIASSTFSACGDTTTPVKIGISTYTIQIPCKIFAFHFFGVAGLAIITSIHYIIDLLLQIYLMKVKTL